jgi:hypothetical protein
MSNYFASFAMVFLYAAPMEFKCFQLIFSCYSYDAPMELDLHHLHHLHRLHRLHPVFQFHLTPALSKGEGERIRNGFPGYESITNFKLRITN